MVDNFNSYKDLSILSAIIFSTEDAIISKTLDGTITSWNPAAEIIFGYTEQEALGKNISLIIPPELIHEESIIVSRMKKGERIKHYETRRQRKDGTTFLAAITISPVKNEKGTVVGASKIIRDISDDRFPDEKQALLAAIIDSSDDAIISKNLNGIITSWNKGAESIFGYSALEVIGKHISIIIPHARLSEETMILSKIRKGERIDHIETVRVTKEGKEINISLTISPVKNKRGKIIGASKIARDITAKIEMEKQRKLFTEKLQELNIYKDEFMAMASHELRTPLTVIKANLQVLENVMANEQQTSFLDKAFTHIDKLSNLIEDLMDVSKLQSGTLRLTITEFDLVSLFREAIAKIQNEANEHEIIFTTDKALVLVTADRTRINQVITNMLTNAVKYSPNSKEIAVSLSYNKDKVIVSVTDKGIGIPQEDLENIFSRFYRVRGIASTFSGSGIGLYISNGIIKQHGGEMWAESAIDKGSTFYFKLPVKMNGGNHKTISVF